MKLNALKSNEFIIGYIIIILSLVTGAVNPAFFAFANLFDILRNITVYGILGMGVLIVILSGNIDVSFPAVAALSSYATLKMLVVSGFQGPIIVAYAIAACIGLLLGSINAFFISKFRLPAMIVTLGTSSMFYGFNLFFVGALNMFNLPTCMTRFSREALIIVKDAGGRVTGLHPAVLIMLAAVVLTCLLLKFTMVGRGIFAIGGNREVAERSGFNVRGIEFFIYGAAGVLASIAGVTQAMFARNANPAALQGTELDVIAAAVLGGASITGGRGTVVGTIIGLTFVAVMKTSLIMLGIPAAWQKVFVGAALVIGTGIPAYRTFRSGLCPIATSD